MAVYSANIAFTLELRTVFGARGMLQTASICPSDPLSTFSRLGLAQKTDLFGQHQTPMPSGWACPTEGPGRRHGGGERVEPGTFSSGSLPVWSPASP